MIWGVIASLPEEIDMLIIQTNVTHIKKVSRYSFYFGNIGTHQLVLVNCCGGKLNAATCTTILIQKFNIKAILSIGVTGSLSDELNIFDIVIADKLLFHDNNLNFDLHQPPHLPFYTADSILLKRCKQVVDSMTGGNFVYKTGCIASGDNFIADNAEKAEIALRTGALGVDMWGAASAQVAAFFEIPFVALRCISDDSDGEINKDFERYFKAAAEQPCHILIEFFTNNELDF